MNAAGLVCVSMLGARLTSRISPRRLVIAGLAIMAATLLGALQVGRGALVSPLVGSSATTMAVAMVTASVLAGAALALTRRSAPAPVEALTSPPNLGP